MSEEPVYPGHPLVLAIQVFDAFDCASDALKRTRHGWTEILSCMEVSGSGCSAGAVSRLIEEMQDGLSLGDAINWAKIYWKRTVGPGTENYEKNYVPGVEQAERLKNEFLQKANRWDWK